MANINALLDLFNKADDASKFTLEIENHNQFLFLVVSLVGPSVDQYTDSLHEPDSTHIPLALFHRDVKQAVSGVFLVAREEIVSKTDSRKKYN